MVPSCRRSDLPLLAVLLVLSLSAASASAFIKPPLLTSRRPLTALRSTQLLQQQQQDTQQKTAAADHPSLTEQIFASLPDNVQSTGAGGSSTYEGLKRLDGIWEKLRKGELAKQPMGAPFVTESSKPLSVAPQHDYDVAVCGGTLGVFAATALQKMGYRVAVIEGGLLQGRPQEWNISVKEVEELVTTPAILQPEDIAEVVTSQFGPMRCGFKTSEEDQQGFETDVEGVLNAGVQPLKLLAVVRKRFEEAGGTVLENHRLKGVTVHPDGASLLVQPVGSESPVSVTSRLVVDCMGFNSPISRQLRKGQKPDGICLVVGSCARGYPEDKNVRGDLIYSDTPLYRRGEGPSRVQYFWEAFPAGSGPTDRTTYMFTYCDADASRPSLETLFEDYWTLLPKYQGVKLDDLEFLRVVFGLFQSYQNSPLKPGFDRVIAVGDASGQQSPLSFGGLAALIRHLSRITNGLDEALRADALSKSDLAALMPYQPNLRTAWLFQRNMGVPVRNGRAWEGYSDEGPVRLLAETFRTLNDMGDATLRPFLLDSYQFVPLLRALLATGWKNPAIIPNTIQLVGIDVLVVWVYHFLMTGLYTLMHLTVGEILRRLDVPSALPQRQAYYLRRLLEAWEYGSGMDYYRQEHK